MTEWRERLRAEGIRWSALRYHKRPTLPATLSDIVRGALRAVAIGRRERIDIFHARSHVGAAIGTLARRMAGGRLIFDSRGLLADEYVHRGAWRAGGMLYRLTKSAERRLLHASDGVVFLTEAARNSSKGPVEVIPCCVDIRRFAAAEPVKLNLGDRLVYVCAGALGGYYLVDKTVQLLTAAPAADARAFALILTQSARQPITEVNALPSILSSAAVR